MFFFLFWCYCKWSFFLGFHIKCLLLCKTFPDLYSPKWEQIILHSMLPVYPPYIHIIIPTVIYKMAHICEMSISLTCRKRSCSIHPFLFSLVQFSCSVVSNSLRSHGLQHAQASLSITNSQSLLKLMPSDHLILCGPLLLLPSIFPSIRVFSN